MEQHLKDALREGKQWGKQFLRVGLLDFVFLKQYLPQFQLHSEQQAPAHTVDPIYGKLNHRNLLCCLHCS